MSVMNCMYPARAPGSTGHCFSNIFSLDVLDFYKVSGIFDLATEMARTA